MATLERIADSVDTCNPAIVFIHGLNGDAHKTWMIDTKDEDTLWPRWLARDLDCSVWLLGYDAKLSSWKDNAMPLPDQGDSVLETLATEEGLKSRHLLLIGHSMGGLVIKTLILNGQTKGIARYQDLANRIRGIVFIATPHNGSQLATLAKYISILLRTNPQVGNMHIHDAHLRSLHHQFLAYCTAKGTELAVRTFSETKGVLFGKKLFGMNVGITSLIVDPDSSEPLVPGEIAIRLPEDHFSICKPKDRSDQIYKSLLAFISEEILPRSSDTQKRMGGQENHLKVECAPRIHIDRLPTVSGRFFGRKEELRLLDDALAGNSTNVIQFIAAGGTGKTKLLRHWLNQHDNDIQNRIVWSFYSQGSDDRKQRSTSPFFAEAFRALNSKQARFGSEEEKANALADLLIENRCLLVLDGLEPLQHVGRGMNGRLKDRAITRLLQKLAALHTSICVITTRIGVHDISDRPHVQDWPLDNLPPDDGVALLRSLGVKGADEALHNAVCEYKCHALALHLLGNAITTYLSGQISKIETLDELVDRHGHLGRHAFKVMQAYEKWLKGTPELQMLYLLGLFDHAIEIEALEVLWKAEIPGLTAGIPPKAWLNAIRNLREQLRLLSTHNDRPDLIDCHPLIREFFSKQLRVHNPDGWHDAQKQLYEYYKKLPESEFPNELEELQPLFNAVAHGCAAGLHHRALYEVFWPRIRRQESDYMLKHLGAFSDTLSVISHFFEVLWEKPFSNLTNEERAWLLNIAGFSLRALGELPRAVSPMMGSLALLIDENDWTEAALAASNLSELYLALGNVDDAIRYGRQGVDLADRSNNFYQRLNDRTVYAEALHCAGKIDLASEFFQAAERLQSEHESDHPQLYSLRGFRYCQLLLERGQTKEVLSRARYSLRITKQLNEVQGIALDQLILGQVRLEEGKHIKASLWVNLCLSNLRKNAWRQFLVIGLLVRSRLHRQTHRFVLAHRDLHEAFGIITSSDMQLLKGDYQLELTRLLLAENKNNEARELLREAETLINETGYHRRKLEIRELGDYF